MGEERTGAEIYGELETCGLWLLACSKESRGRGGQFSIEGTRMTCGGGDTYRAVSGQYPSIGVVSGRIRALFEVSV